jgi:hypothetical protein
MKMGEEFHDYAIERETARQQRKEFELRCKEMWEDDERSSGSDLAREVMT